MRKTRINRRTIRKQTKRNRRQNRRQRGGKDCITNEILSAKISINIIQKILQSKAEGQVATSHGIPMGDRK